MRTCSTDEAATMDVNAAAARCQLGRSLAWGIPGMNMYLRLDTAFTTRRGFIAKMSQKKGFRTMNYSAAVLLSLVGVANIAHADTVPCAEQALAQAPELLRFHYGEAVPVHVDEVVRSRPRIRNPGNRAQKLDVVEVTGNIYRASYRMRFLFFVNQGQCALVGQEILEHANL